jgi:hypothetical protein
MSLDNLLELPADSPNVVFRFEPFGKNQREQFIREVLGLANADVTGDRYLVFGVHVDGSEKKIVGLTDGDIKMLAQHSKLILEVIEPEISISRAKSEIDGVEVAAIRLKQCPNPPYIIKDDFSENLKKGECWVRENGQVRQASRQDLDRMYGRSPTEAESGEEPVAEKTPAKLELTDKTPEEKTAAKLKRADKTLEEETAATPEPEDNALEQETATKGELSMEPEVAPEKAAKTPRPEKKPSDAIEDARVEVAFSNSLDAELLEVKLPAANGQPNGKPIKALELKLDICNKNSSALKGAMIDLNLPRNSEINVGQKKSGDAKAKRQTKIDKSENGVRIRARLGDLAPDEHMAAFLAPVLLGIGAGMRGKKIGLKYMVVAENLATPIKGRLKIKFTD